MEASVEIFELGVSVGVVGEPVHKLDVVTAVLRFLPSLRLVAKRLPSLSADLTMADGELRMSARSNRKCALTVVGDVRALSAVFLVRFIVIVILDLANPLRARFG